MVLCTVPLQDFCRESPQDGRVIDLVYPREREIFECHLLVNDTSFRAEIDELGATITRHG